MKTVTSLGLVLAMWCLPCAAGGARFIEDRCEFRSMERWKPYTVRWAGVCVDGVAQGRGVLRAYRDGRVEQFFFGTFEAGQPRLGVIERPDGYVAGRFSNGKLVPDTDRNVLIRSFREGSTAAASLSKSLGQSGNKASASYYLEKSRQLAAQMD